MYHPDTQKRPGILQVKHMHGSGRTAGAAEGFRSSWGGVVRCERAPSGSIWTRTPLGLDVDHFTATPTSARFSPAFDDLTELQKEQDAAGPADLLPRAAATKQRATCFPADHDAASGEAVAALWAARCRFLAIATTKLIADNE